MSDAETSADATEAASNAADAEPLAYALDAADDYPFGDAEPSAADGRVRWALSLAALFAAVAALISAATYGVRTIGDGASPVASTRAPVTVVQPSRTVTLTEPDQDTAFLMDLRSLEPRMMATAGAEIHNARFVCSALLSGQSVDWVAQQFGAVPDGGGNAGRVTMAEAQRFIPIAIKHYCPGAPGGS